MEKYVKYLRKSRFDRDYADLSVEETLKRHEAVLDKLAQERDYRVVKTYYEVVSGESIAARPEVQKLLEEVSAGAYAGVLVVDLERLARGNSADQAYISQVFQYSGTKIVTPNKTYDPANEFDEEYFEFGLFMSRREYKTINRRLIRGRDSSAKEGKWLGSVAPYGYRRVKLEGEKGYTLEPVPEEAGVVRRVFALYAQGEGTKAIANRLNDLEIPTRHGGLWTASTVSNFLGNPVYIGKIRRGWSRQVKSIDGEGRVTKKIRREREVDRYPVYDGLHPALVEEALFRQVQKLREERRGSPRIREDLEPQNPFAGLLFCGICGRRVDRNVTSADRGSRPRLRCVNMRNCHNASAEFGLVEEKILGALEQWLAGYRVKLETVGFGEDIAAQRERLARLEEERDRTKAQLETAYDLMEQGIYTKEEFRSRRETLEGRLAQVKDRYERAEKVIADLEERESSQSELVPKTETLLAGYGQMTSGEKNRLLRAILYRVEYVRDREGKITIDLYPRLPQGGSAEAAPGSGDPS